jgi:hypothetical protein
MSDDESPKIGRPTLCTPENVEKIIARLKGEITGTPVPLAQALLDIVSYDAYKKRWRANAAKGLEPYADAVERIDAARDHYRAWLLAHIHAIAEDGKPDDGTRLRALQWTAEKQFRNDFDEPKQIELSGPNGGALKHEHHVSAEQLCDAIESIAVAIAGGEVASRTPGDPAGDEPGAKGGAR